MLLNLLDNAIRHTPPRGNVIACARRRADKVEVEVVDDGSGIAAGEREHVFEAFFRGGQHAARSDNGTGLGLAIARAIVNAHGGEIWLAPTHRGTRVCFSLPAVAEHIAAPSDLPTAVAEPHLHGMAPMGLPRRA